MEDLSELFKSLEPNISSDSEFMTGLVRNLERVESVKQYNKALKARCRKAVVIAGVVGFVVGFISAQLIPWINYLFASLMMSLPQIFMVPSIGNCAYIISWALIGAITIFTAYHTYDISLALMNNKRE